MEPNGVQESLKRLQEILSGRTLKDLLSNVDTQLLPPANPLTTTQPSAISAYNTQGTQEGIPTTEVTQDRDKIIQVKEEKKEKKKKKKKDKSKDKDQDKKKKSKALRVKAGDIWVDESMEDWPENDYRIFCGNLGNEVSDEMLSLAFRRYPSFHRAKVVRDRKTSKSKGYGFISLLKADDYIKAMKEMNGQYIGNRPVKLTRSKWKDRSIEENKDELKELIHKKIKKT